MAARSGTGRALRPVRLDQVPEHIRLRALEKLLSTDGSRDGMFVVSRSLNERIALGNAAYHPSERVYWVSDAAYQRVFRGRIRR